MLNWLTLTLTYKDSSDLITRNELFLKTFAHSFRRLIQRPNQVEFAGKADFDYNNRLNSIFRHQNEPPRGLFTNFNLLLGYDMYFLSDIYSSKLCTFYAFDK